MCDIFKLSHNIVKLNDTIAKQALAPCEVALSFQTLKENQLEGILLSLTGSQ